MYDSERMRKAVEASGLRKRFIAERLQMSYAAFIAKLNGKVEWKASEIVKVSKVLGLDSSRRDTIFFS